MVESLWEASKGDIGIRRLRWVHPKLITFSNSPTPKILTEKEPFCGIEPPPFKFAYRRLRACSGFDTRAGIMCACAWMYLSNVYLCLPSMHSKNGFSSDLLLWRLAFRPVNGLKSRLKKTL